MSITARTSSLCRHAKNPIPPAPRMMTATPNQIEFIELIVKELTENDVMEADRLFQSPFTDLNAQGPLGIFPSAKVSQIVEVLTDIRKRAVA